MVKPVDGKKIAAGIIETLKEKRNFLLLKTSIQPGLAVIIVGDDPASHVYVAAKSKKAQECGFFSRQYNLEEKTQEKVILSLIEKLNADCRIHGILVQLPLPSHMDSVRVTQGVSPEKDVDGFHFLNAGKVFYGKREKTFVPCTPAGAMVLITQIHGPDLSGLNALVIGRSNIVGKPMASLLLAANATVTIAHSRTKNPASFSREADILVAAVGKPEMVKGEWIKPGATVIDVGINRIFPAGEKTARLVGDVDYASASLRAGAITPVPGGVGPMTIAMLMANTLTSAYLAADLEPPDFFVEHDKELSRSENAGTKICRADDIS